MKRKTFSEFISQIKEETSFKELLQKAMENPENLTPEEEVRIAKKKKPEPAYAVNIKKT